MRKFKRSEFQVLANVLSSILKNSKSVKLNTHLIKLKNKIVEDADIIKEALVPSDKFKEYDKKRQDLCAEYALKKDGKPVIVNNIYQGLENNQEFIQSAKVLAMEYKDTLAEYKNQIDEVNDLLKEEIELDYPSYPLEDIPDNLINGEDLEILIKMKVVD